MTLQAMLWAVAGLALAIALFAGVADWRRGRRSDLDRVGWVPWSLFQILGGFIAVIAAALALHS